MTEPTPSVLILGAGLVGSSLGLALTRVGYDVLLWDIVAAHSLVAAGLGAGRLSDEATDNPDIVVVATPPEAIPALVAETLEKFPEAVITDVGSVKAPILEAVVSLAPEHRRYVGSHPMAGSQFTGPLTASGDLFRDRTWVVTPQSDNRPEDVERIERLDPHALRENFALVSQHPALFFGSVADNIRYGHPDASDADVEAAADDVRNGRGLSVALAKGKRFPRLALQMIQVGEESGAHAGAGG